MRVPTTTGPNLEPKMIEILLHRHPKNGPPILRSSHEILLHPYLASTSKNGQNNGPYTAYTIYSGGYWAMFLGSLGVPTVAHMEKRPLQRQVLRHRSEDSPPAGGPCLSLGETAGATINTITCRLIPCSFFGVPCVGLRNLQP